MFLKFWYQAKILRQVNKLLAMQRMGQAIETQAKPPPRQKNKTKNQETTSVSYVDVIINQIRAEKAECEQENVDITQGEQAKLRTQCNWSSSQEPGSRTPVALRWR